MIGEVVRSELCDDQLVEAPRVDNDTAYESNEALIEVPCENKIGYSVLCGSCPLVRLWGECPKMIREQAENNEQYSIDAPIETLETLATIKLDASVPEEESMVTPIDTESKQLPPAVVANSQSAAPDDPPRDTPEELTPGHKEESFEEHKERPRSYLELLFDDEVSVVLAPQFRQSLPSTSRTVREKVAPMVHPEAETIVSEVSTAVASAAYVQPPLPIPAQDNAEATSDSLVALPIRSAGLEATVGITSPAEVIVVDNKELATVDAPAALPLPTSPNRDLAEIEPKRSPSRTPDVYPVRAVDINRTDYETDEQELGEITAVVTELELACTEAENVRIEERSDTGLFVTPEHVAPIRPTFESPLESLVKPPAYKELESIIINIDTRDNEELDEEPIALPPEKHLDDHTTTEPDSHPLYAIERDDTEPRDEIINVPLFGTPEILTDSGLLQKVLPKARAFSTLLGSLALLELVFIRRTAN